jgi:hypothetical protein
MSGRVFRNEYQTSVAAASIAATMNVTHRPLDKPIHSALDEP